MIDEERRLVEIREDAEARQTLCDKYLASSSHLQLSTKILVTSIKGRNISNGNIDYTHECKEVCLKGASA